MTLVIASHSNGRGIVFLGDLAKGMTIFHPNHGTLQTCLEKLGILVAPRPSKFEPAFEQPRFRSLLGKKNTIIRLPRRREVLLVGFSRGPFHIRRRRVFVEWLFSTSTLELVGLGSSRPFTIPASGWMSFRKSRRDPTFGCGLGFHARLRSGV